MQQGVFVTGTDTDVGKTWIGQALIRSLSHRGMNVIPRKPVESGWQEDIRNTDAGLLMQATGKEHELALVCPHQFREPVSPVRAAAIEQRVLLLDEIKEDCLKGVSENDFLYVEGAGGFYSPLVSNGLNADLAVALDLPILLVVGDRLGCINHVLLTIQAIKQCGLCLKGLILNSTFELSEDEKLQSSKKMNNFSDLKSLVQMPVFLVSYGQKDLPKGLIDLLVDN